MSAPRAAQTRSRSAWRRLALVVSLLALSWLAVACGGQRPRGQSTSLPKPGELLPARTRRLTNAELERAVSRVLGMPVEIADRLPPDVRQDGYSPNADQALVAAAGVRWAALVDELTERAVRHQARELVPCDSSLCRDELIARAGRRAWRRPLSAEERRRLAQLYELGRAEGGASVATQLTLSALLQSPHFLYVTELGAGDASSVVRLTENEIASALSFTLSGEPPDDELLQMAERGELSGSEARREQAWRILAKHSTRHHFRRFVLEWLEVDGLSSTAKDPEQHPRYEQLKAHMLSETQNYVDEVMVHHGASVSALLAGGFASVDPTLARYYDLEAFGPVVPVARWGRVGVLQHASFLSSHAHPDGTSPVKRGDFILRRVLCRPMPRPAELGIEVVMPAPVEGQTTRQRFARHTADPQCYACHQTIDPLGYAFESFDAAGRWRETEQGLPVDTKVVLSLDGERVHFDDSAQLSRWLARQERTRRCFARQAFRYFSAQSDSAAETAFLAVVDGLPSERRDSLVDMMVAFAASELFIYRNGSPRVDQGRR